MSDNTAIAIPKNLKDLCELRDKSVNLYEAAYSTIKGIEGDLNEVKEYLFPYNAVPKTSVEDFKRDLDNKLWQFAFTQTGLLQYMDAKAKDELEEEMRKAVPEFTLDNVRDTLLSAVQDADKMFARGIVNVFHDLSKEHRTNTNSPFSINQKAILGNMVAIGYSGGLRVNSSWQRGIEKINDIDRVIKTLDGKKHQPRGLECLINVAWKNMEVFEDDYYRIKGFKNGNMHIEFKRQDLLDKANLIIARYYDGNNLVA